MSKSAELFPELRKQRQKRKVLMHYIDVGINDCVGDPQVAIMKFTKCGKESGWIPFRTVTQVKRGIPCDTCNESIN